MLLYLHISDAVLGFIIKQEIDCIIRFRYLIAFCCDFVLYCSWTISCLVPRPDSVFFEKSTVQYLDWYRLPFGDPRYRNTSLRVQVRIPVQHFYRLSASLSASIIYTVHSGKKSNHECPSSFLCTYHLTTWIHILAGSAGSDKLIKYCCRRSNYSTYRR